MSNRNPFSLKGMSLLFNQYLIHNGRLVLISIVGFTAGLFVLLYSIQLYTRFDTWTHQHFVTVFMPLFIVLAWLYAGSSFPGLRSRRSAIQYLTLPLSLTEKFFFEFFTRIVLFVILMPGLYWVIFYLEGQLVALINPNFTFQSFSFTDGFQAPTRRQNLLIITFVASHAMLCLTAPFLGATVFRKHQIIKTIAWGFGILFAVMVMFNDFIEIITKQLMFEYTCFIVGLNLTLILMAYLKLKRKQIL